MTTEIGQIIDGKYKLVRLLGTGGMGAVYEGENLRVRKRVAIKMLHGEVSSRAESVTRFEREAQAAGRIGSEHICEVYDLGVLEDGTRYMVMEYLEGDTLSGRIKQSGKLLPLQSIPLLTQVLEGLGAAHAAGIIHRDLKPDNLWVIPQKSGIKDFVKILDFGVSKFASSGDEMNMTRAGAVVGTPYYMSPEQARGMSEVDARTDIYALGVLLYQATTGQVPYQAETFNELLFKIVLEVAPPPQTYVPNLDPEFAGIIQRAMAREPAHRYQNANEFRDALLAFQAARAAGLGPIQQQQPYVPIGKGGTQLIEPGSVPQLSASQSPAQAPSWASVSSQNQGGAAPVQTASQPMATSNSWGNASSPGAAQVPPKRKAGLFIGVALGAVALCGGGAAAFMAIGNHASGSPVATSAPATDTARPASATQAPAETATAANAPAPPPSTVAVAATATATASAVVEPSVADVKPVGRPTRGGGARPSPRPAPPAPPPPPPVAAPRPAAPPPGNDLGY